jgi:hypothetical protein
MLPIKLEDLRERLKVPLAPTGRTRVEAPPWLQPALPDGGFPTGVTELSAPRALGGATLIATQAIALAQRSSADVHCAWVDPEGTLYGPGLMQQGVDLSRLIVVRPPRSRLRSICVRIARSGAVALLAIDFHPVGARASSLERREPDERWVRRLQLACEEGGAGALLLSDSRVKQPAPLPVALKLSLSHAAPQRLTVSVLKERSGRTGQVTEVRLP